MRATSVLNASHRFQRGRFQLEQLIDVLLDNHGEVVRVVCDGFGDHLAPDMGWENIAHRSSLTTPTGPLMRVFRQGRESP